MIELLEVVESSGFSMFLKESSTIYVLTLALHAIGLAFAVGISITAGLRVLGVAPGLPLAAMKAFFPLMYLGVWITLLSGLFLTIMYPLDYFTDGTIYVKLVFVVVAVVMIKKLNAELFSDMADIDSPVITRRARMDSILIIVSWIIVITAGRIMAYTWVTKLQTIIAAIITLALMLGIRYLYMRLFHSQGQNT
jgi:hypothetical protein